MDKLIDFDTAKHLKEMGFDEPTKYYRQKSAVIGDETILPLTEGEEPCDWNNYGKDVPYYSIPTEEQVREWIIKTSKEIWG